MEGAAPVGATPNSTLAGRAERVSGNVVSAQGLKGRREAGRMPVGLQGRRVGRLDAKGLQDRARVNLDSFRRDSEGRRRLGLGEPEHHANENLTLTDG